MKEEKTEKATPKARLAGLKKSIKDLMFLLGLYRRYALWFLIITVVFWALWGPANSLLSVYTSRIVIDHLVKMSPYLTIVAAAAMLYGMRTLLNLSTNALEFLFQYPRRNLITDKVNREIFVKALGTDYKYYDSPGFYADFTWAAQNLPNQMEQSRSIIENLVQNFTQFIAMTAYISIVGPWVLVITLAGTAINAFLQFKSISYNYKLDEEINPFSRRKNFINRMFYTVDPAADLKSTHARDHLLNTYDEAMTEQYKTHMRYNKRLFLINAGSAVARNLTTLVITALIVRSVTSGDVADVALYASLLAASGSLNDALWNLSYQASQFNRITQYTNRIRKFFETESTIEATDGVGAPVASGALSVDMCDITFAYGEVEKLVEELNRKFGESKTDVWRESGGAGPRKDKIKEHKPILKGLDMHIAPGEKIAIVGENGAGKSTMMKLLLRLYDVQEGEIRIGGRPVSEYDVRKLRDAVGIAFQDGHVYALPLRENLRSYRDADDEKLTEILHKVGLSKLLEEGKTLDTQVTREFDNDGIMLSGGEMQKFTLARLLTGEFGLLILDEPTASLDPLAEYELNKLILDRTRPETTIVIAHRLSTIRDADRIYLIDGGCVAECGTHDELMALHGKYADMFTKQSENYVK